MPMTQREALEVVVPHRGQRIVVSTMSSAGLWPLLSRSPLDFAYIPSAMGHAPSLGLGLALAQPERGVIALEGDGSILMGLGCLATIANMKPRNLTIIIWDNGIYQITGKQQAATGGVTDIVAVARGAGIAASEWVRDEAHFDTLLDRRFDDGGPFLLAVKIDDEAGKGQTPRDPSLIRSRFMRGLGTGRGGALEA